MTFSWLDGQYLGGPVYTSCCYFWMYLTEVYKEPFHYLDFVFKTVRFVSPAFCVVSDPLIEASSFWKNRWIRFLVPWGGNKTVFKAIILRISMNDGYPRYEFKKRRNVRINVTLSSVRVTIVDVEDKYYILWMCLHSCLSYPAWKSHHFVPYYSVLSGLSGCTIFFHVIINDTIFWGGEIIERKMYVLMLYTTFLWSISHVKRNSARYVKCTWVFM